MAKVEALDHAKRQAAVSFARMASDPEMHAEVVRDEQEVLRARVDVLNTLMKNPDAKLCLESSTDRKGVCVTYDRVRCEGELELGPMQSTMAWAVRGAEDTVLQLMSAADNAGHAPIVKSLLQLVQQSAPRKDILQGLQTVLSLQPPERLVLRSLAGMDAQACDAHTRVFEGLGEAAGVPPLYRVVWGALDLNVLEGWQNPSTNACVRLSILDTAHQAAREAQQTKAPAWSNVAFLQVRIFHGEECHTLTLRPFCDSESCTVTHLQYRQSVFDDSGPERGILNLSQDPASIHPIPLGKVLPIQAYVCLGAHRKSRLNEAQLNYVHAQGLLAHGFKTEYLPDPAALLRSTPGKMVPAKATRVSGDKLDVMASSYHVADQVYTTISVVQYPPFGTQFGTKTDPEKRHTEMLPLKKKTMKSGMSMTRTLKKKASGNNLGPNYYDDNENFAPNGDDDPDAWAATENLPDYVDHEEEYDDSARVPFEATEDNPDQVLLYLEPRRQHRGRFVNKKGESIKEWFTGRLEEGQFYFIDGVHGDPYNIKHRAVMFDCAAKSPRYHILEQHAKTICSGLRRTHGEVWDPTLSFYDNIWLNPRTAFVEHGPSWVSATVGDEWSYRWSKVILEEINQNQTTNWAQQGADFDSEERAHAAVYLASYTNSKNFWYCPTQESWIAILQNSNVDYRDYIAFSQKRARQAKRLNYIHPDLQAKLGLISLEDSPLQSNQIPLPKTVLSTRQAPGKPIPELATLQSRIDALESKLSRTKQEANTQHLLLQVLEKLEETS